MVLATQLSQAWILYKMKKGQQVIGQHQLLGKSDDVSPVIGITSVIHSIYFHLILGSEVTQKEIAISSKPISSNTHFV